MQLEKVRLQAQNLAAKDHVSSTASVYKYHSGMPSSDSIHIILTQVTNNAFIEALCDIKVI